MKLIRPSLEWAEELLAYRAAFRMSGERMDGTGSLSSTTDMQLYVRQCAEYEYGIGLPDGHVPATQLMLVDEERHRLLGMLQIRHELNDYLALYAGHIGYSVRPSERRKGYAKKMLAMSLPLCRALGLDRVMITCFPENEGSRRTILANGGVYEYTSHDLEEHLDFERYWITLSGE